jgi:hypothetical protein
VPVASVALLALFVGLWYFVTFEETAIPTVPRQVPAERAAQAAGRGIVR